MDYFLIRHSSLKCSFPWLLKIDFNIIFSANSNKLGTIYNIQFNIKKMYITLIDCIYVFFIHTIIRIISDYIPKQHELAGLWNGGDKCFL
jgi:hypothetical protein